MRIKVLTAKLLWHLKKKENVVYVEKSGKNVYYYKGESQHCEWGPSGRNTGYQYVFWLLDGNNFAYTHL